MIFTSTGDPHCLNYEQDPDQHNNDFKEHDKVIYLFIYFMTSVKRGVTKKRHKNHDTAVILQKSINDTQVDAFFPFPLVKSGYSTLSVHTLYSTLLI